MQSLLNVSYFFSSALSLAIVALRGGQLAAACSALDWALLMVMLLVYGAPATLAIARLIGRRYFFTPDSLIARHRLATCIASASLCGHLALCASVYLELHGPHRQAESLLLVWSVLTAFALLAGECLLSRRTRPRS